MCIYIYIIYMYIYMHHIHMYIYICIHTTYIYMYSVYIYTYMYILYIYVCMCIYIYIHIYIYVYMYILYVYIYIHMLQYWLQYSHFVDIIQSLAADCVYFGFCQANNTTIGDNIPVEELDDDEQFQHVDFASTIFLQTPFLCFPGFNP